MKIETSHDMIAQFKSYVLATRKFGHTYIHANVRNSANRWEAVTGSLNGRAVVGTYCEYGRSIQGGGNKYKAHFKFSDTGKPVPSKLIASIR